MEYVLDAVPIGVGATLLMDAWILARKRLLGIAPMDYGLVGRWLAWLPRGRFRHHPIRATPPVRGESVLGWSAHYLIGIAFAAALLLACGTDWSRHPTPGPALAFGLASVAAPFLVLQPGFGMGVAASNAPQPWATRLQTVVTHAVFGAGLYLAALAASVVSPA